MSQYETLLSVFLLSESEPGDQERRVMVKVVRPTVAAGLISTRGAVFQFLVGT